MSKIVATLLLVVAIAGPALGQDKLGSQKTQVIVEQTTPSAVKEFGSFLKKFDATILKDTGPSQFKVISVPSDKVFDFVEDLKTTSPSAVTQILSQHYTSLFQPASSDKLTPEQKETISRLSQVGVTNVFAAPRPKFATYALSKGFGPADGFGNKKAVALNLDDQWLVAVDAKRAPEEHAATWFTRIKGETGGASLTVTDDGIHGFVRKGKELFLIEPFGIDDSGARLQVITKFAMPRVGLPDHPPDAPPIPVGKAAVSLQRSVEPPVISILFAYTKASRNELKAWTVGTTPLVYSRSLLRDMKRLLGDSNARLSYTHADTIDIEYDEKLKFHDLLAKVTDRKSGFLSAVHEARERVKANIVAIMVSEGDACGHVAEIGASRDKAIVVVRVISECFYKFALAHEIGHLHGLVHDTFDQERPGVAPPFRHGYGYRHDPTWRSPMANDCKIGSVPTDCLRLSWTNPRIACPDEVCLGDRFGDPRRSDEVLVLEDTAKRISKF